MGTRSWRKEKGNTADRVEGSRLEQSYEQHRGESMSAHMLMNMGDGEKNPGPKVRRSMKYLMFLTFCFICIVE